MNWVLLFSILALVGGFVALVVFFQNNAEDVPLSKKNAKKAAVLSDPIRPVKSRTDMSGEKALRPLQKWEYPVDRTNELSDAELRKWRFVNSPPPGYTNETARSIPKPEYAIFEHRSENEIACLLSVVPGKALIGTPIYDKRFTDDFLKSCETPIVITDDDTPEQAELKRLMIDTKNELCQRMREGEDLGKILLDTRAEYQRLATYRQTLEQEINKLKQDTSLSMQDIDDFVDAANIMLESKGIAPITLSPISRRMLMRSRSR